MGIKHLNRFLKDECNDAIKFISLGELSGKKIAVDISIYMYKYESNETLLENMYLILATFRKYNIILDKQDLYNMIKQELESHEYDDINMSHVHYIKK